ncbi:hypothetical protein BpHYR1_001363 [Brachionus plicatilis]|uniref:Uncharacterized protein n=1 Tax=Brachionus plicatilis TaxID=10195 RepID=A0A3M7SK74_BRAPC|nr:hypothetical protein BpHYR1_001363 [Brachionus plicatilis]
MEEDWRTVGLRVFAGFAIISLQIQVRMSKYSKNFVLHYPAIFYLTLEWELYFELLVYLFFSALKRLKTGSGILVSLDEKNLRLKHHVCITFILFDIHYKL